MVMSSIQVAVGRRIEPPQMNSPRQCSGLLRQLNCAGAIAQLFCSLGQYLGVVENIAVVCEVSSLAVVILMTPVRRQPIAKVVPGINLVRAPTIKQSRRDVVALAPKV